MTLLNDILDFSKIESGKLRIEKLEFDIYEFIDELKSVYNPALLNK